MESWRTSRWPLKFFFFFFFFFFTDVGTNQAKETGDVHRCIERSVGDAEREMAISFGGTLVHVSR